MTRRSLVLTSTNGLRYLSIFILASLTLLYLVFWPSKESYQCEKSIQILSRYENKTERELRKEILQLKWELAELQKERERFQKVWDEVQKDEKLKAEIVSRIIRQEQSADPLRVSVAENYTDPLTQKFRNFSGDSVEQDQLDSETTSVVLLEEIEQAKLFREISNDHRCDKALLKQMIHPDLMHTYHWAYSHFMSPLQGKKLKILEIGLGCGMPQGPGSSFGLWKDFLGTQIQVHFIEYDGICGSVWGSKHPDAHLYIGDQGNETFLADVVEKSGGNFDIIIDDGGHYVKQQITSLRSLFSALKKGGLYFLEDLCTSYYDKYKDNGELTTMELVKYLLDGLNRDKTPNEFWLKSGTWDEVLMPTIHSISCWREICVFSRA